jgi:transcription initiation factor IIE alpha subunit
LSTKSSEARSTDVRARAEANFKKEERAKEGAKAMLEYQTNSRIVREKMSRLKALRLAKEAADKEAVAAAPPAAKRKSAKR